MFRTFDSYETATDMDGFNILGRIQDRLLESPDCRYNMRVPATPEQQDNWDARMETFRLRLTFDHMVAALNAPETRDEVTTDTQDAPAIAS